MKKLPIILTVAGILILGASIWVALLAVGQYGTQAPPEATHQEDEHSADDDHGHAEDAVEATFDLTAGDAQPQTVTAESGQTVHLRFIVPSDHEFHIHGYDRTVTATADQPAEAEFTADQEGRFEIESHNTGTAIGVLEVNPR